MRSVCQKSEFLISIFCQACVLRTKYFMFANTRVVWVKINNIGPKNTLLQRSAPSGIWYFPNKWYFSTGISIPIPSTMQIALCGRWYCYLVFVSGISKCYGIDTGQRETPVIISSTNNPRGTQKNERGTMTKICQLWRPTYLPPRSPSTAKSRTQRRRGGRGGSPISRPVLFSLRTCADVRFSVPPRTPG